MQQQQTEFLVSWYPTPAPAASPAAAALLTKQNADIEFPSWDGQLATKQDFIFLIKTDWTRKLPGINDQSQYLLSAIVDKVSLQVVIYSFDMLHWILDHLQGNHIENQILAITITDLATLGFKADDTSATYMTCILQGPQQGPIPQRHGIILPRPR